MLKKKLKEMKKELKEKKRRKRGDSKRLLYKL